MTSTTRHARHRFAVLVPAHNEERLLGGTLKSLAQLDYPDTHYVVHVVADNCSDATAQVARSHGAAVHERVAPDEPGKGPALSWLLDRLWASDEPFDAIAIFDADTVVSPGFLRVMDARLARGERVVQGYYAARDPGRSWAVAMRYAALAVRHYLRPLGRTALGSSAGLHGNGMVLSADVMRGRVWTGHLTEDIAFEAELLLDGQRVTFAADAVVEAEMPARLDDARTQNARWEQGRLDVVRRYVPRLARAAVNGHGARVACADAAADHLVPPFSLLVLGTIQTVAFASLAYARRRSRLSAANLGVSVSAALVLVTYLVSGLRMVRAPRAVWRALARAPVFVAWKARESVSNAVPREAPVWIRTARND